MNTDEWIKLLATGVEPIPRYALAKQGVMALLAGVVIALGLLSLIYGVRADLSQAMANPAFWIKLGVPLSSAILGLLLVLGLAYPGRRPMLPYWVLSLPLLLLWGWAAWTWLGAEPASRPAMLWGHTWRVCVWNISLLALPMGLACWWLLRKLAPTRPGLTGGLAGWFAGGMGAAVYALHCPEMAAPFLAIWYVLGMLLPSVIMAYAGHRWLRW